MKITEAMLNDLRTAVRDGRPCVLDPEEVLALLDERKALREAVRSWRDQCGITQDEGSVALALGEDES
jgi:hypothetical protein